MPKHCRCWLSQVVSQAVAEGTVEVMSDLEGVQVSKVQQNR